jgi:hypothetical protein
MLECLWIDTAEVAVPTAAIVRRFGVIENVGLGQATRFADALLDAFFRLLKNDSTTALSRQLPRRLILACRSLAFRDRCQSSLPYCEA